MSKTIVSISLIPISLLLSICITWLFIRTGFDWSWAKFFERNPILVYMAVPGVLAGMVVPLGIIIVGFLQRKKSDDHQKFFLASLFSFLIAYLLSTLLKVLSNRVDMEPFEPMGMIDFSHEFRFGFLNSNSWWESFSEGWPSGHSMVTIAMTVAGFPFVRSSKTRRIMIIYCLIILLSVSTSFHWISDVVSGIMTGSAIGYFIQFKIKSHENYSL